MISNSAEKEGKLTSLASKFSELMGWDRVPRVGMEVPVGQDVEFSSSRVQVPTGRFEIIERRIQMGG